MMTEDEMIANGKAIFGKCYGDVVPLPERVDARSFSGMSMKMFNDFWGDERLTFREKRLVVLGVLAGKGADPSLFGIHARSALQNAELSAEELRAVVLMTLPYVGFPHASPLYLGTEKIIGDVEAAAKPAGGRS